ncbi:MAG: hypothetical protein GY820_34320 [Gammaproteobacteria bacterium]|nr:hypothetical protein [Gammaproteobacteria bacterium]
MNWVHIRERKLIASSNARNARIQVQNEEGVQDIRVQIAARTKAHPREKDLIQTEGKNEEKENHQYQKRTNQTARTTAVDLEKASPSTGQRNGTEKGRN